MQLTTTQERMLAGGEGEIVARMMRLLVRLGDVYGADTMLPIGSAQISGISYKSIGDPGLEFLEDLAEHGARFRVLTSLNPAGMDLQDHEALGFPADFAVSQKRIMAAFEKIGAVTTATCTPYLVGNLPRFGEHIAWAESSAVSYANSVIGARSNREGGPSALAAAICGVTPRYGLHLDDKRRPTVHVKVEADMETGADFGALGYHVGGRVKNGIPFFTGIEDADPDDLKSLGAAMAASGAVAMYHIEGITPEAGLHDPAALETVPVTRDDLRATYDKLNTGEEPDLIVLGCPHASLREITRLARKVEGRKLRTPVWICTARATKDTATKMGLTAIIEEAGGRVVADTCMVVSPIERMGKRTLAVTSGKAANYLPGFCKQQVVFHDIDRLLSGGDR